MKFTWKETLNLIESETFHTKLFFLTPCVNNGCALVI